MVRESLDEGSHMVIPLDSPQWKELEHAYGAAGDVPDLIRAIEAEKMPNYNDGGIWNEVYSSLYHQYSVYSATYAALPHIVRIGETGTLAQRVAVMCLAGHIRTHGNVECEIPDDLVPDFDSALATLKTSSLKTVREAAKGGVIGSTWSLAELLQAFGGLRYPKSGYVVQLDHMVREEWQVESHCPLCGEIIVAELREEITTRRPGSRRRSGVPKSAKKTSIDRSSYPNRIVKGKVILARDSGWEFADTSNVLSIGG
jgi:hypothetical protein